jgi:hypothetical protein
MEYRPYRDRSVERACTNASSSASGARLSLSQLSRNSCAEFHENPAKGAVIDKTSKAEAAA